MSRFLLACSALVLMIGVAMADEVTLDGMKSDTPASWKAEKPSNKFRAFQFSLPKAKGDTDDGELVVFFFGPGGGGGINDNLKRWKSMFEAPEGKTEDQISKVETHKLPKAELTYLDIAGTYLSKFPPFDPNAKVTRKANFRRLGVVFSSENGPYFITLTGPAATISEHKTAFDNWLKNFK